MNSAPSPFGPKPLGRQTVGRHSIKKSQLIKNNVGKMFFDQKDVEQFHLLNVCGSSLALNDDMLNVFRKKISVFSVFIKCAMF